MMPRLVAWWVVRACLVCSISPAFALDLSSYIDAAERQGIAEHKQWLNLLHCQRSDWTAKTISQVDDPKFFFAKTGKQSAFDELVATLEAFYQPPTTDINQHPLCRFPARWDFLQSRLSLPEPTLQRSACVNLQTWLTAIKPHRATLVLASAYLNSPSSMYGHTLLRLDPEDVEAGSDWLSYAVTFAAEVNDADNSLLYAFKGLVGGYAGYFSVLPYYEKIKDYNRIENRDLWEYSLDLTPTETLRLVLHLWELQETFFAYYFFDENCSYRLLELLEVARPSVALLEPFKLRAIPTDTIRQVNHAGLIKGTAFKPSQAKSMGALIEQLSADMKRQALALAAGKQSIAALELEPYTERQRAMILRVAYHQLQKQQQKQVRSGLLAERSLAILSRLSELPNVQVKVEQPDVSPDQGHKTVLVSLAGGTLDEREIYDLRVRPSYHDLLDSPLGYLPGAALNIGELQLRAGQGQSPKIEQFNLISIKSHTPRNAFFKPLSWRVQAGLDRLYAKNDDFLTTQINGGAGVTHGLTEWSRFYVLLGARMEYNELVNDPFQVGMGPVMGALFHWPWFTLNIESNYFQFSSGRVRHGTKVGWNLPLGRNQALRLNAQQQHDINDSKDEFSLEYRQFF